MIERPDPPHDADERATLAGFLDYYRATPALDLDGAVADPEVVSRAFADWRDEIEHAWPWST